MRDIAFILLFFVMIFPALTNGYIAVMLWVWVSLLGPGAYLYSVGADIPFAKAVAVITFLAMFIGRDRKQFTIDRTSSLVLGFLAVAAAAQLNALEDSVLSWDILDKLWKIVLLNLLILAFIRSHVRMHAMLLVICASIGFLSYFDGLKYIVSIGSYQEPGFSPWGDNNHVGLIVAMSIPTLLYLAQYSDGNLVRIGVRIATVLSVLSVLSTTSRGAFVGLVVIAVASGISSRHRVRYLLGMAVGAAALLPLISHKLIARLDTIKTVGDDNSFMGRVVAWKICTLIALQHPLLGGGLHVSQTVKVWSAYSQQFDQLSFIPTDLPSINPHAAHSIYFELLADTGFTGLILFLCIAASCLLHVRWIRRATRGRADLAWAYDLAGCFRLTIVVFLVSGGALSATYHDMNFIYFGLVSALRLIVKTTLENESRPLALQQRRVAGHGALVAEPEAV